jgi:uncharacterized protein (DUF608 family)
MKVTEFAAETTELLNLMAAALKGHHPYIQGTVLADLLAMFLAGHYLADNPEETDKMREALLTAHIAQVRRLIPRNEKLIIEGLSKTMRKQ